MSAVIAASCGLGAIFFYATPLTRHDDAIAPGPGLLRQRAARRARRWENTLFSEFGDDIGKPTPWIGVRAEFVMAAAELWTKACLR
jgi:hypothetical protein